MRLSVNICYAKRFFLLTIIILSVFIQNVFSDENNSVILRRFPTKFHVKFEINLNKNTMRFPSGSKTKYILSCAIPTTNDYHEVGNITTNKGEIIKFDNSDQRAVRIITENSLADNIVIEYDISVYKVHVDLDKIRKIYSYDTASVIYKENMGKSGRIEPDHPQIIRLANKIKVNSQNALHYAKNAFIELQKTLKWKDTGNYSNITNIFRNKGGDCAALSSVLISLLRNYGIPSRYITGGVIKNQNEHSNHVWVEFYLEGYGWIPADPSITTSIPYIGYFSGSGLGFYRGNKFVQTIEGRQVETGGGQDFRMYYRFRGGRPQGDYSYNKKFTITLLKKSNIEEEYNSRENIKNFSQKLFNNINEFQKNRNIKPFTYSHKLSQVLTQSIKEKVLNNKNFSLKDDLQKINYKSGGYWYWTGNFSDVKTDITPYILKTLNERKILDKTSMNEISIGYYYNDLQGGHNIIVALTNPR